MPLGWDALQEIGTPPALRRALDHLTLRQVDVHTGGERPAGRVGGFDVSADASSASCACRAPPHCAHALALLAAAAGLDPTRAPAALREGPRPAFSPDEPPAPVPAYPAGADLDVPADALSDAQRAAVEATEGIVRTSTTSYSLPRAQAPDLTARLETLGSTLVVFARRPYVRLRATRQGGLVRLLAEETPGQQARRTLSEHGFRPIKRAKSLVHEYEGDAQALHLLAEELARHGTGVVLPQTALPGFEPLAPTPAKPRTTAPTMPVVFSRSRFDWWTPREGLPPLALAILQRHALASGSGLRFGHDGLRAAERELGAAGLTSARVEEGMPTHAFAERGAEGEAVVRIKARPLPGKLQAILQRHGFATRGPGPDETLLDGPAAALPALAVDLAHGGAHLQASPGGWPPIPPPETPPAPNLFADDPRLPIAREGTLAQEGERVTVRTTPEGAPLSRALRIELHRMGWLREGGRVDADAGDAGRLVALLRAAGFDARWPRPRTGDWRLATVRYSERTPGGGTLVHLRGPLPLGRLGGVDPAVEAERIGKVVAGMEARLLELHPDARPLAAGAMPGVFAVDGGAGRFLLEASARGASVLPATSLAPTAPAAKGVVLVDQACLPPRLMEFRRTVDEHGVLRPVVSHDIEATVRRLVPEGLATDEERGHFLVPSTRMQAVVDALREMGVKVLQRRLAPRGQRYARWEPELPEDSTGARPRLREGFRGRFEGDVPGLRPETILDPHQREGLAFILHHGHSCLLADEMGLGKTLTAIASAQFLPGRVLVVCPASARGVWKQEVHAWTTERVRVLAPGEAAEDVITQDGGEKYVVVAYSGLARFVEELKKLSFDLVVLDESHYVKSRKAQRTKLVMDHLAHIPRRLVLSGTPVMNEPQEIRTQLSFIHPQEWSDTAWFNRRFSQPWKHGTGEVKDAVLRRLRQYLEGVMLRREKRQALPDLPEKHLHVHRLQLTGSARRAYDEQEDEFRDYMQEHDETALTQGMTTTAGRLERLKQTSLIGKLPEILARVKALLEADEKVVVFCHYREPIEAIAKELEPYGVVRLTGSTDADARGEVVRRFQEEAEVRVFVGQTVAAGVAVTLTSARHAVFCDLEWNPALHRQAMDRVHRKTQTREVEVHFFLADDTIEEDIAEVLEEKTEMMDMLLEGRSGGSFGLRDREAVQREVALRVLSRRRRLMATDDD